MLKRKASSPLLEHYVSNIDRSLLAFNRTHAPSPAQREEIEKYKLIYKKRDHAIPDKSKPSLWDF